MRILDFFKRIIKEDSGENIVKEKLNFSEIEDWIKNKRKENNLKEKETLVIIREKIKRFISFNFGKPSSEISNILIL